MKIVVSATGPTMDDMVDPRFGRCQYLVCVDPETMQFEAVDNSGSSGGGGVGISTAQVILKKQAGAVLTGHCGPNAFEVLSAACVQVITGVGGKVKDAISDYKSGKYQPSSQPNVSGHFGQGRGTAGAWGRRRGKRL